MRDRHPTKMSAEMIIACAGKSKGVLAVVAEVVGAIDTAVVTKGNGEMKEYRGKDNRSQ